MGNLKIKKYESDDANEFRIRTKRQKKRARIEARDKQLIRMYKEYDELSNRKQQLPTIDLVPPVQKGWKRYFVVRNDVRQGREGVFYENLLRKINTVQYSPKKEFTKKRRKNGRKIYEPRIQFLGTIYPYELVSKKFTNEEMACMSMKVDIEKKGNTIVKTVYYEISEPWRYVLRIRPNIIKKVKVHDMELEQQLAQLRDVVFENHTNKGRIAKLKGWGNHRWRVPNKNPYKNKPIYWILEQSEV